MRSLFALLALTALTAVSAETFAVIAAGSSGFGNYRHQADACHAYQVLRKHNIPAENIILMMADDVANASQNPFPGKLFNKPSEGEGDDVYEGCVIDYRGEIVTAQLFLDVIEGKEITVGGTGRTLKSTSSDEVFLTFFDHGGTGLIAFPYGPYLYADKLNAALKNMHAANKFHQLTFYMEACESGSMFDGSLADNLNIYAVTAANPDESSWGTYCPPQDKINGKSVGSCLGDLFSVNWMQDSETSDMSKVTLEEQFQQIKNQTTRSHVMRYGNMSFTDEPVGYFQANLAPSFLRGADLAAAVAPTGHVESVGARMASAVNSRDAQLHYLTHRYASAAPAEREAAKAELEAELQDRERWNAVMGKLSETVQGGRNLVDRSVPQYFDCLRAVVDTVEQMCGKLSDYSLQHTRVLNNLCELEGGNPEAILRAVPTVC